MGQKDGHEKEYKRRSDHLQLRAAVSARPTDALLWNRSLSFKIQDHD